ncbi:hypothetical protein S58_61920 [Bradyrhizobium oligotrophicum S58]|uniref:Uncharacterized protein n=1 Tax=Bradyrhizobium oligotrophicum S58 TaxID=1245469 RepID=M4ZF99_9BRAD|nr:hypothetical protein S58_61920 [Bradyrhizobium oligotrophicum S58]
MTLVFGRRACPTLRHCEEQSVGGTKAAARPVPVARMSAATSGVTADTRKNPDIAALIRATQELIHLRDLAALVASEL